MQAVIFKLNINDGSDFDFIEVEVSFYDEKANPCPCADVSVFLKKDPNKTINDIKADAVQKAKQYLKSVLADHHE